MKLVTAVLLFGSVVAFAYGSELIDETMDTFRRVDQLLQGRLFTICDGQRLIRARLQQEQREEEENDDENELHQRYRRQARSYGVNIKKCNTRLYTCEEEFILAPSRKPASKKLADRLKTHMDRTKKLTTNGTLPLTTRVILDKVEELKDGKNNVTNPNPQEETFGDGPIGKFFGEKLRNDLNFIQTQEIMQSGNASDELVNRIKDKGLSDGLKELDQIYNENEYKPFSGDLLEKALRMEQTMMAVTTQQVIDKNLDNLKQKAEEMSDNLNTIQSLQAMRRNASEAMNEQLDNVIRQKTKAIELAKGAMSNTINRLEEAKLINEKRFSDVSTAISQINRDNLNITDDFEASADLLSNKIDGVNSQVTTLKSNTEFMLSKLTGKLASGRKLLENSTRTVTEIENNLSRLATSMEEGSKTRIEVIRNKIASISDKLDSSLNLTNEIRTGVVAIKTHLDDTNSYLNEAAESVDRQLLQVLLKEEKHQILQSYLLVKNRIKHFESEFYRKVSKFKDLGAHGQMEALSWANSVIYGDASGMAMDECLFHLKNMIIGRSVIFQHGSILDWYLAAAQLMVETKNGVSATERKYMDTASRYFITLQITGYTLLTTAHFIRDNKVAMTETCLAMEDELWETDKQYARYIAAASPTLPNAEVTKERIATVGSALVLDELSFESSKLEVGAVTKGQLVTCALCRGCTSYLPPNSLGIRCHFKDTRNGQLVQLPRINYNHLIKPTIKPHNSSQLQFVAGLLRLRQPEDHTICSVFFSQRINTVAISLGVHVCDRRSGRVLGTDDGTSETTPVPELILRDGTAEDGSDEEHIETVDHVMTSFPGLDNLGWIVDIGLKAVTKRLPGNPPLRVLQLHIASNP